MRKKAVSLIELINLPLEYLESLLTIGYLLM